MKTKTMRVSVDLLAALEKKLLKEGKPSEMLNEHLGIYINEILWSYAGGKLNRAGSSQSESDDEISADERAFLADIGASDLHGPQEKPEDQRKFDRRHRRKTSNG